MKEIKNNDGIHIAEFDLVEADSRESFQDTHDQLDKIYMLKTTDRDTFGVGHSHTFD